MGERDEVDELIELLEGGKSMTRKVRITHSFRLEENTLKTFLKYCDAKGASPGQVVDTLIRAFLKKLSTKGKLKMPEL